ncbi:hypothetical protein TVAG_099810 [Trichomonas vaginalis G3]|uniref:Uncharacterized protein n=1 Tax=Trichomonas vaginalis (strain ATCC PRA-98 / G3) TaxID=412133 RepID=A2EK48_TRIV3|nr:hypothetical protein TVAGG3_0838180 [Trichomonas vaginalis G3]EAY06941.1 hypothetical protein TVAG_099810 [Trichomonas vaginalis G3]KAI5499092.1 hypothetical protein TVAGG3_0838180 [Trichomonas vaginalis G3]|eukprot:XP_001319164.1 hypothetical protein [Trichomonas vaginalis G3]
MNYIYLPPVLEIVECEFKDISVIADSGSAINFDHPMYEFLSYDPKIKIDSCLFLNCVSDSCPGAVRINYTHAQVSINKMCSLNCGGNYYTVLHILNYSPILFNSSTIYSTNGISSQFDGAAMAFYNSLDYNPDCSAFISGMNHTDGRFTMAPSLAINVSVEFSILDNLTSATMLGWLHSCSRKCNFVELRCSRWYTSFLANTCDYEFIECVFYKTEILDIVEAYN